MTEKERNTIDELRDRQPFRVPDGYFEGFTENLMSRLPQKAAPEGKVTPLYERLKPWLYIAATFAGVIILFNVFYKPAARVQDENLTTVQVVLEEDNDEEFLDFIEDMFAKTYFDFDDN